MSETILLNTQQVREALSYPELIPLMKTAFAELSAGRLKTLPRNAIFHEKSRNILAQMPASVPALGVSGTKIAMFPGPGNGPTAQSAILLFDCDSGALKAIVAAGPITGLRTAASSAAATDVLAMPDAEVLCLMGAGGQALCHAQAMCAIRPIREIRVWSHSMESAERGAEKIAAACPNAEVKAFDDAKSAVSGADIICTVSKAKEPILFAEWLKPGAHVNAVGAVSPANREIDVSVLKAAKVYLDQAETSLGTAGDLLIPMNNGEYSKDEIVGELGAAINGEIPGRAEGDKETITLFESVGLGAQDVVAAYCALQNTKSSGSFEF